MAEPQKEKEVHFHPKEKGYMSKLLRVLLIVMLLAGFSSAPVIAAQGGGTSDKPGQTALVDNGRALVQLAGDPLSTYIKTKPPQGKKIDFNQSSVKSYRAQLSALRNDFKAWLHTNAPKARITGEFDISLNAVAVELNGETLAKIASAPKVIRAEYEGLYYPTADDPDLSLINATLAWDQAGGSANAGAGIKVAIVDSGIDVTHPCFSDAGYPAQTQLGDKRFTNNKVIVAKVFNNKLNSNGFTAEAIEAHGTHVSGTVACNYQTPVTIDGVTLPYKMSGVAPRALLGNYNVFPGNVENARSEDILNALEAAYSDGFDVANMSLGGNAHGIQDLLTVSVDNLDRANMVVSVSAGNEGPGYYTAGSPGSAARALTAGASEVGHQLAVAVQVGANNYPALRGDFGTATFTAPLKVLFDAASPFNGLSQACEAYPAGSLSGSIALITRGTCDFTVKLRNVQAAGGLGAVVVNREPGLLLMGTNGEPNQPTIPGYMVEQQYTAALKALDGQPTTLKPPFYETIAANNFMADFSSQGPTDVDFRVKPDVVAPGMNIVSSIPQSYCGGQPCFAFYNGTSMAAPHLAGSAAIVRQQHPTWSAAQVRSAIVNTANNGVLKDYLLHEPLADVNITGAGLEDLAAAVRAKLALDPVSVSFGAVPAGSGQTRTFPMMITNISGAASTLSVAIASADSSITYSVSPASFTLSAGASVNVIVSMTAAKGAALGNHQAWLNVSAGGAQVAHAAVYVFVK
jgi:subtilisin family serine protease